MNLDFGSVSEERLEKSISNAAQNRLLVCRQETLESRDDSRSHQHL